MFSIHLILVIAFIKPTYRIFASGYFGESKINFRLDRHNGSVELFNYEKSESSDCVYDDIRDTLICMKNHPYDAITSTWRNMSERIKYIRVNCLSQEKNSSRMETCVCKNRTILGNSTRKTNNENYYSCQLERIRDNMFSSVINARVIDLSYNKIRTTDARSFENCTSLEYLLLKHNPISGYPYEMLCGLSRLKYVDFSHQMLTHFPSNMFKCEPESQSSILVFNISHCRIENLVDDSIKYLNNLLSLDMSGNRIKRISENVFQGASSLVYLNLSDNKLNQIPRTFCHHLSNLKHLILRKNQFEFINLTHLQNCQNVVFMDLSQNVLRSVEGPQSPLASLKYLKLGHNRLLTISRRMRLKHLPSISELDFSWNRISSIEDSSFDGVRSILRLDLSNNNLTEYSADFRRVFKNFRSLGYLDISSNNLTSCSNLALDEMGSLKELDISHNKLENITDTSFTGAQALRSLTMNHNKLQSIDHFSFMNLSNLQSIDLSHNMLVSVESVHLPDIIALDVSWNKLEHVPSHLPVTLSRLVLVRNRISSVGREDFKGLSMLKELNLSHNSLRLLESDTFLASYNLTSIDLSFNALNLHFGIKDVFRGLKQIRSLVLKHNNITSIDAILQFGSLSTLQSLDVSYNKIEQIKQPLNPTGTRRPLQNLNLEGCKISWIIISAFVNLPSLKLVNLQRNRITNIPLFDAPVDSVFLLRANPLVCSCNMSWLADNSSHTSAVGYDADVCEIYPSRLSYSIRSLSLDLFLCLAVPCPDECSCYSRNETETVHVTVCTGRLVAIPVDICNTSLTVYLDGNNFTGLGIIATPFVSQISVRKLYMNNSGVLGLGSSFFNNTAQLEEVDLSYNSIKILPGDVFRGLMHLKFVSLQHNQISHLPSSLFTDLKSLETFDISFNELQYILSENLHQLDNMEDFRWINLASNPWQCECSNKALRNWLEEKSSPVLDRRKVFCKDKEMIRVPFDLFSCPTLLSETSKVGLICVLLIVFTFSVGIFIAYYRSTLIPVAYRRFGMKCLKRKQISKSEVSVYDLVVLVDDKDHKCVWWVKNSLLPKLAEQKPKFRIHVPDPNIEGGEITITTVYKINQSNATLILASKQFQDNDWCVECSRHAYSLVKSNQHAVLLLLWGDINVYDLDSEIREQIEQGDNLFIKDKFFWDKLMYKLPDPDNREQVSSLCRVKNGKTHKENTEFVVENGN